MKNARIVVLMAGLFAGSALTRADGTGIPGHRKGMKVTSALLTTMSGKLGGAVAATAKGGVKYFRALVFPGNPRSQAQTTVRAILGQLAGAWRTVLTDVQRAAYEAIAPSDSSGIDAFVKANSTLLLTVEGAANGYRSTAPASLALGTPYQITTTPVIDDSANTLSTILPAQATRLCGYAVFITSPQSASRGARQFSYRYLGQYTSDQIAGAQTIAIPAAFQGSAGQVQYVKLVALGYTALAVATGQTGTPQEFRCTIVA